jgi:hypothetical protein
LVALDANYRSPSCPRSAFGGYQSSAFAQMTSLSPRGAAEKLAAGCRTAFFSKIAA